MLAPLEVSGTLAEERSEPGEIWWPFPGGWRRPALRRVMRFAHGGCSARHRVSGRRLLGAGMESHAGQRGRRGAASAADAAPDGPAEGSASGGD
jgi:hypothetical protein